MAYINSVKIEYFNIISNNNNFLFMLPTESRYNFLSTADYLLGYKHSPEAKLNISSAIVGRQHSEEAKANMSDAKRVKITLYLVNLTQRLHAKN
jgi:NUMOD3 motif